ncbi:hypothetical protein, partial [Pseudomonas japonica]|uniref:hypothetical protein n=1 Tax=Pseudomonas japonica TaxID=256466 RepID=UPI0036421C64
KKCRSERARDAPRGRRSIWRALQGLRQAPGSLDVVSRHTVNVAHADRKQTSPYNPTLNWTTDW